MKAIERVSEAQISGHALDEAVKHGLELTRARIALACARAGRRTEDVAIVAVTKGFGAEAIIAALDAHVADIGENYYQEAARKFAALPPGAPSLRKHFIGRVQRNKAKKIAALFDVVQTLDSLDVAEELDRGALAARKSMLEVLIQINIAADDRAGVDIEDCEALASRVTALPGLNLRGIMAVGPQDPDAWPEAFARAAACRERLQKSYPGMDQLSLGMSADLEQAVEAGATMVRLGTALFGARPQKGG